MKEITVRVCRNILFVFFFSLDLAMLYSRVKIYLLMDTVFWHLTGIMMKRVFFFYSLLAQPTSYS